MTRQQPHRGPWVWAVFALAGLLLIVAAAILLVEVKVAFISSQCEHIAPEGSTGWHTCVSYVFTGQKVTR